MSRHALSLAALLAAALPLGCSADPPPRSIPHAATTRVVRSGLDPRELAWCAEGSRCPDLVGDAGAYAANDGSAQ